MRYILIILALAAIVSGVMFAQDARQDAQVKLVTPTRGAAVKAVYATGSVEASVMLPIAPRAAGRLLELNADEGSRVEKDAVLARLEATQLQATRAQLKAEAAFAHAELTRQEQIFKAGYGSKQALERARAAADSAAAAVRNVEAELSFTELRAPAPGVIIRRDGEIGELIPVNQPVFWMSCCAQLRVTAEVDEEDIPHVRVGQDVLISADAYPGEVFKGKVAAITPKGDAIARSYRVRIALDGDTKLMIGMTAETNIIIEKFDDALLIPSTAVRDGKVFTVKDGIVQERAVKLSVREAATSAVAAGLDDGDAIVADPAPGLQSGDRVGR